MLDTLAPPMARGFPAHGVARGLDGHLFAAAAWDGWAPAPGWAAAVAANRAACGTLYEVLVVPPKQAAYADMLPDAAPPPEVGLLLPDAVIDPVPGLRARRRIAPTYARGESGWNDYGAYCASLDVIEALRGRLDLTAPREAALAFKDVRVMGDLAARVGGEAETARRVTLNGFAAWRRIAGFRARNGDAVHVFEGDAGRPRAVVLGSDGLGRLLAFLCPHVSRLVAVGGTGCALDVIRDEAPDLVLTLVPQAALALAPERVIAAGGFAERSGVALPLPRGGREIALSFGVGGNAGPYLGEGWSAAEPGHVWTVGAVSTLVFGDRVEAREHALVLDVLPCLLPPARVRQRFAVEANGVGLGDYSLEGRRRLELRVSAEAVARAERLTLTFRHPDFFAPSAVGPHHDDRPLAVCFEAARLRPI